MSTAKSAPPPGGGIARNVFHLGLGQVTTTVLTIVLTASVARSLGAADFGLLYLLSSIATFAYVFVDWGHGPYITREVARRPDRSGDLMGTVLAVRAATALVVGGLAVMITWLLGYDLRTRALAAAMIATWLPMYLGLSYAWAFRGRERMDCDALINVVLKLTWLILALTFLFFGGRLLALILVPAIAGTMTFVLAITLYQRLRLPPLRVTASTARELVRDGAPLLAVALTVAVQPYIDANILYKLAPRGVVGWYGAAWGMAGTLIAPATILTSTMFPRLSRAAAEEVEFKRALRTAFRPVVFVAVLGAVGTYLFADFAVGIVYSRQRFGPAGDILRAFAPVLLLIYVDLLIGSGIVATGSVGPLAGAKLGAVLVTTALEFILIPWCQTRFANGGIGIMFAMTGGELVMVTAACLLIRRALDGRMLVDLLRGLLAGAATMVLMRSLPAITPFIGIPVCVLMFLGLSVAVGLVSGAELQLLTTVFRKRSASSVEDTRITELTDVDIP